jgi:hypothetical protein
MANRINDIIYNNYDRYTGEMFTATVVTTWHDGTVMTDAKVDNAIYFKNTVANGGGYSIHNGFKSTKEIDIRRYGLLADGTLRTISQTLPYVTLAQVQSINPSATLSNSADWYIISLMLKILPINSTILLNGFFVVDQEIIIKRGKIKLLGINSDNVDSGNRLKTIIKQIKPNADLFRVIEGDGTSAQFGVGLIDYFYMENLRCLGTMTATNLSGDGISFNQNANLGTCINWNFKEVSFGSFKNGFRHYSGSINDFFFDKCDFSANFNNGMFLNGNNTNQTNYFTFLNCGFSINGYDFVAGGIVTYSQIANSDNYDKGGFRCRQVTALNMIGVNAQVNYGIGFLFESGAQLGVFISGYAEANLINDIYFLSENVLNVNAGSFYSLNNQIAFINEKTKRAILPVTYSQFNETNSFKKYSENLVSNSRQTPILYVGDGSSVEFTTAVVDGTTEITTTGVGLQRFYLFDLAPFTPKNGEFYLQSIEVNAQNLSDVSIEISVNGGALGWTANEITTALNNQWYRVYKLVQIVDESLNFSCSIRKSTNQVLKFRNHTIQKFITAGTFYEEESVKKSQIVAGTPTAGVYGKKGDIKFDASFIYICIADNTWSKSPLTAV